MRTPHLISDPGKRQICKSHDWEGEMLKKYQGLPEHGEYQQDPAEPRRVKAELCHCGATSLTSVSPSTMDDFMAKDPSFTPSPKESRSTQPFVIRQSPRHPRVLSPCPTQHQHLAPTAGAASWGFSSSNLRVLWCV